ncbi:MAG: tetratricopeptide repeat protein [Alistipes sp.]|nr:tetratricopeptide repeat protein [Alistipes sp.]
MKKVLFLAVAMLMFALPAANAQKVNTSSEVAKLEKADAAVLDAKKGLKAATWIARGNAYTNAFIAPTKELGRGVPEQMLMMNVGRPEGAIQAEFMGAPAIVYQYEYVDVYVVNGMIEGWNQKKAIKDNVAEIAIESFAKAYELDPKQASKISAGCANLANALVQQGEALNNLGKVSEASRAFELAYNAQCIVPEFEEDGGNLFNAGLLMTMHASTLQGEEAIAAFKKGEEIFTRALEAGYDDGAGNIYYFLFHCYYGQKDVNRDEYLAKAKETLLTGIKLYPKNNTILDGLMQLYTAEEGVGDPAELTAMIETSLADDPTNYDLWFGRGRVYNALKNYDECIKSFEKCVELRPDEFESNFYTGYFIIEKANAQVEALNSNAGLTYDEYEAENAKINLIYAEAIPWLEKAHTINPTDGATIEYLNSLCFRLRDMDGMMDKYNKYHELYMQMR